MDKFKMTCPKCKGNKTYTSEFIPSVKTGYNFSKSINKTTHKCSYCNGKGTVSKLKEIIKILLGE